MSCSFSFIFNWSSFHIPEAIFFQILLPILAMVVNNYSSCQNRARESGVAYTAELIFSQLRRLEVRGQPGRFLGRTVFLACGEPASFPRCPQMAFSLRSERYRERDWDCSLVSLLIKTSLFWEWSLILKILFRLNYFLRSPISKLSCTGGIWGHKHSGQHNSQLLHSEELI